jgi:hypothetical protein
MLGSWSGGADGGGGGGGGGDGGTHFLVSVQMNRNELAHAASAQPQAPL